MFQGPKDHAVKVAAGYMSTEQQTIQNWPPDMLGACHERVMLR